MLTAVHRHSDLSSGIRSDEGSFDPIFRVAYPIERVESLIPIFPSYCADQSFDKGMRHGNLGNGLDLRHFENSEIGVPMTARCLHLTNARWKLRAVEGFRTTDRAPSGPNKREIITRRWTKSMARLRIIETS